MPKRLQKYLELSADQRSHLLHTFAVDAKIAVARAGSRTEVNCFCSFIEEKLYVIDETEQQAGEFIVEIRLVLIDELGPRQCCEYRFQRLLRFRARLLVPERRDGVVFIGRLRRDAIRTRRTRGKSPIAHDMRLYALLRLAANNFMAKGGNTIKKDERNS